MVPLAVTLAAAVVLRERVSSRRYGAIVIGFVRELATRRVSASTPALSIAFMTAIGNTVLLGAVASGYLLFDEVPDGFTLVGSALILGAGLYAICSIESPLPVEGAGVHNRCLRGGHSSFIVDDA